VRLVLELDWFLSENEMSIVLPVKGKMPQLGERVWLAPNATVVGDVTLGNDCTVWFNAVVRGDVHFIKVGDRTNIQDGAVIHGTYEKASTTIGNDVSIGHNALVHGCTVGNHVLIGMGAIVMDNAVLEDYCMIAAGAVVLENTVCESGYLYAGIPAKKIKPLDDRLRNVVEITPPRYMEYASWFQETDSKNELKDKNL
jgi:carbonic anhydrase/acetyltransferase-like protein (isoleucine patch superfamily)